MEARSQLRHRPTNNSSILSDQEEIVKPKRLIYVQDQESSVFVVPNMELFGIICVSLRNRGYKLETKAFL